MIKSASFFTATFLLLTSVLFFSACQKEYSYEGGDVFTSATYTFVGTNNSCTGAVVSGTYSAGIALTAENTVQLQVDVTDTGAYNIGISGDGIFFSATGNFSATGVQQIILNGSGIPSADGNIVFHTPSDSVCPFTVTVNKKPTVMAGFTLAGAPGDCINAIVNGSYHPGVKLTNANTVDITVNVASIGAYTISTDTINGISFSKSGAFTATGAQTVTLAGSGTPVIARNLVFTPSAGGVPGCTFSITITPQEPTAVYVLESGFGTSNNPCTYTLSGNITGSIPLDATNTVTLRVYVSSIGNFAIATDVVNGMLFAYSGAFTATGSQDVTLTGSGTPIIPGTYTLTPQIVGPHPLGGQACAITETVK